MVMVVVPLAASVGRSFTLCNPAYTDFVLYKVSIDIPLYHYFYIYGSIHVMYVVDSSKR